MTSTTHTPYESSGEAGRFVHIAVVAVSAAAIVGRVAEAGDSLTLTTRHLIAAGLVVLATAALGRARCLSNSGPRSCSEWRSSFHWRLRCRGLRRAAPTSSMCTALWSREPS